MANKFWVGGTGSWSDTAHWATSSGTAGGTGIPATGDVITFDANSGGGVVTGDVVTGLSFASLAAGAFGGTLDFSGTNPNLTFTTSMNLSGTGARKFLLGSGTFTFSSTANTTVFDLGTVTNLDGTSVFTANFTVTGNATGDRTFNGGGRTFGTLTYSANTSRGQFIISGANTFAGLSLAAGAVVTLPQGATNTVSAVPTLTGTSSNPISIRTSSPNSGIATLSVPSGTVAGDWLALYGTTATGGATFNATNSFDIGRNTGWSITAPSGGASSGGQRVISG